MKYGVLTISYKMARWGGQAKTETRPGPESRGEGSDLRMPDGGQAVPRLPTEVSLGLMRSPDTVPGQGM